MDMLGDSGLKLVENLSELVHSNGVGSLGFGWGESRGTTHSNYNDNDNDNDSNQQVFRKACGRTGIDPDSEESKPL